MTPERFDEFYRASVARLTGQLYSLTGDITEAQDVVQDAFVKAWQHRAALDSARSPEAWVRTAAWRTAISRFRRIKTGSRAWSRVEVRNAEPPAEPTDPALVAALKALPEEQRYAVVMFHLVDLSVQEIADEVGCPVGTIKARLSRGRAALAASVSNTALAEDHHG